jgi:hypothetical protein
LNISSSIYWPLALPLLRTVWHICPCISKIISLMSTFLCSLHVLDSSPVRGIACKDFLQFCRFSLAFVLFPWLCRSLWIWCNPICQFLFLFPGLLESYSKSPWLCLYLEVFSLCFSLVFLMFHSLTLRSLIHFAMIFVQGET